MKNPMSKWAEKLMSKAHREVREYEKGRAHKPSEKEEMPMGGCGAKIQPGNFWGKSRGRIF